MTLRFDGRVAIVTGAGGGLGRAYALELAKRGARVVVNDLGTSFKGEGKSSKAADAVVEEIRQAGGEAIGNYDSVTDGAKIVQTALEKWGQVDIVINNAGILRDVSFAKMTEQDWKLLHDVHLTGSYAVTKAAWETMRKRNFGRIIMVGSAAGLYGNHGQANYSTVKMGLVGLSNTLAQEGKKLNITCNTIAPVAGSRMTETVLPPDLLNALKAEYVSPLVLYLVHESCKESGGVYEVGAGWMSKLRWERTKGHFFPLSQEFTIESVRDNFEKIRDFTDATHPVSTQDAFGPIMSNLESAKSGGAPSSGGEKKQKAAAGAGAKKGGKAKGGKAEKAATVDVAAAMAHKFEPQSFSYTDKEVILYALGVGAAADPWDDKELRFTYENHPDFQVLPTFGVVVPSSALGGMFSVPGLSFNPMMLLHGEQYMELKRPFPTSGTLTSEAKIAGVYDKGKGALLLLDVHTKDDKGQDILYNQYSMFIRGLGGFGGPKSPAQPSYDAPARPPDVVHREAVPDNQALLYRLSGDRNPLHADPAMASVGGFNKPILHGLCSFGYATRAVLKHFCDNDVKKFKSIKVRFVKHVFPGETLITEMWQVTPTQIIFRVKVAERGDYVLSNCMIELHGDGSESAPAAAAPASPKAAKKESKGASAATSSGGSFKADAVFAELKKRVNADAVNKVKASYRFDITQGSATRSWLVDLKRGSGSVAETGKETPADCQITMKDDDFVALMNGKLNPQSAFMKGQLKVKGNMMLAQKLSVLTAQPAKL